MIVENSQASNKNLNTRRRVFLKKNAPKKNMLRGSYFLLLCLYDATAITATIMIGQLVEIIQNPTNDSHPLLAILAPSLLLFSTVLAFYSNRFNARLTLNGFNSLKMNIFKSILSRPKLTHKHSSGELNRIVNDDATLLGSDFLSRPIIIIESALAFLAYLGVMIYYAFPLSIIYIILTAIILYLTTKINKSVVIWHKKNIEIMAKLDSDQLLIIEGAKILERLDDTASDYMLDRYQSLLKQKQKITTRFHLLSYLNNMIFVFYSLALPSLLTIIGIILAAYSLMPISGAFMMLSLTSYINSTTNKLQTQILQIQTDNKTFERIEDVIL